MKKELKFLHAEKENLNCKLQPLHMDLAKNGEKGGTLLKDQLMKF
jgi:hypothetical protein